jgi:hypothetical protein
MPKSPKLKMSFAQFRQVVSEDLPDTLTGPEKMARMAIRALWMQGPYSEHKLPAKYEAEAAEAFAKGENEKVLKALDEAISFMGLPPLK